jgi:hypothetical protein
MQNFHFFPITGCDDFWSNGNRFGQFEDVAEKVLAQNRNSGRFFPRWPYIGNGEIFFFRI